MAAVLAGRPTDSPPPSPPRAPPTTVACCEPLACPLFFCTHSTGPHPQVFLPGLPSTPAGLFDGRRRRFWIALQGRFKRPVSMAALSVGSQYSRPFSLGAMGFAAGAIVRWMSALVPGGLEVVLGGPSPCIAAPWASSCQVGQGWG